MLSSINRLSRQGDIIHVVKSGSFLNTPFLKVHYLLQPARKQPRIAVVVSKKVHTSAVVRHKLKRWMRVAAKHITDRLPAGIDMVWIAKPTIVTVKKLKQLEDSVGKLPDTLNSRQQ